MIASRIAGTGSYIPQKRIPNHDFQHTSFYDNKGDKLEINGNEIIDRFESITKISERRYVSDNQLASDLGYYASREAIKSADIDVEELDLIIFTHNWGDVRFGKSIPDTLPSLASRVKHKLGIHNPSSVCYDMIFGCPGWIEALKVANLYIKSGEAKKVLVVASETISRVCDPFDRDSMLFGDGAGAAVLEARETNDQTGFLSTVTRSDAFDGLSYLKMGNSSNPQLNGNSLFLKMNGRKVYEYAVSTMPGLINESLEKAGLKLTDIKKIIIHQSNCKMNKAIFKRLCRMNNVELDEDEIMPSILSHLGNSSVATVPILLDMITKGQLNGHQINKGDTIIFASVGAGMNANAVVYKHY